MILYSIYYFLLIIKSLRLFSFVHITVCKTDDATKINSPQRISVDGSWWSPATRAPRRGTVESRRDVTERIVLFDALNARADFMERKNHN